MYQLEVEGMSCGHCVGRVTKSILAVDAAAKVEIDLVTRKVNVETQAALAAIASAVADAGYPVASSRVA